MNNWVLGRAGEDLAETLISEKGYEILERGFRCPAGEIDIICTDGSTMHFVEVKTRSSRRCGLPEEAVDGRKQLHMRRAAVWYINEEHPKENRFSFDVVSVTCEHLKGVF
ncbi:MAG: YraN family protein [Clostridia bacterium]|nr:YraN family protein [Clostridia bacterium]